MYYLRTSLLVPLVENRGIQRGIELFPPECMPGNRCSVNKIWSNVCLHTCMSMTMLLTLTTCIHALSSVDAIRLMQNTLNISRF